MSKIVVINGYQYMEVTPTPYLMRSKTLSDILDRGDKLLVNLETGYLTTNKTKFKRSYPEQPIVVYGRLKTEAPLGLTFKAAESTIMSIANSYDYFVVKFPNGRTLSHNPNKLFVEFLKHLRHEYLGLLQE